MNKDQITNLMNPVRIRIMMAILRTGSATTREVAGALSDIPQASLYRHMKALHENGFLQVQSSTQIRGTVEKRFALAFNPFDSNMTVSNPDDKEELTEIFYNFAMTRVMEFREYISRPDFNLEADMVGFRTYPMQLSDSETKEFVAEFSTLLGKYMELSDSGTQQRESRSFSFILQPSMDYENRSNKK